MRKYRKVVSVIVLLLILVNLSGCFLTDSFVRQVVSRMELKKKYGEDFIMKYEWRYRGLIQVMCSPYHDQSITFMARFYKDGELARDTYTESVVGKQIQERLTPILQEISDEVYIQPTLKTHDLVYSNMDEITIENYSEFTKDNKGRVRVYFNKERLKETDPKDEYKLFQEIVEYEVPCIEAISIFFIDKKTLDEVRLFYQEHDDGDSRINDMVTKDEMIHIYYGDEGVKISCEEYCKKRQKIY